MSNMKPARRSLITAGLGGSVFTIGLAACDRRGAGAGAEEGVSAVEDLMREHGVLRRVLNLYAEVAALLSSGAARIDGDALGAAAALFRTFGEDYHERDLEERFILPELNRAGGETGRLVDELLAQHRRGREITDYIRVAAQGDVGGAVAQPPASTLGAMSRMYNAYTAWEDTIVFPAWKEAVGPRRLPELAEQFEEIEHRTFGKDGFGDAVRRVEAIEKQLGVTGVGHFTAPAPPVAAARYEGSKDFIRFRQRPLCAIRRNECAFLGVA